MTSIQDELRREIRCRLSVLRHQIDQVYIHHASEDSVPPLQHWIREVEQIQDEFKEITIRWKESVLRVVTEPIILEGVHLGPFAIDFRWANIGQHLDVHNFEVRALKPNPSNRRDDVFHSHGGGVWQLWMQWLRHRSWLRHRASGFSPGTQHLALAATVGWSSPSWLRYSGR